ncbi:MogA/MoaB family molybdenum cofactor biosynthesis protein [Subtercola lobariae]|uniref:MoaB/Mog domain-containing protein n=1 Tax=Subtercola lobariae TaxID=1588641 RepID=A0A917F1B0_9MICO|nr:MogA/MoaB family molybdenum cofactor biosynthesis protein [Subtercola lobariae]GGF38438.1 hypothetical protein GCM10011399_34160 [Subtercola lobariae]
MTEHPDPTTATGTGTAYPTATGTGTGTTATAGITGAAGTAKPAATGTAQPVATGTAKPADTGTAQPASTAQPTGTAQPTSTAQPIGTSTAQPAATGTAQNSPTTTGTAGATSAPDAAGPTAAILIVSTRAAAGVYADLTGPRIAEWLTARGCSVTAHLVESDGPGVTTALSALIAAGPDLVITSGGTGIHPGDRTPDQTSALLDFEIPGFAEELRRRGSLKVANALLSRGVAGVAGSTIVVNLPGSSGGVKDGLGLLDEVLDHMLDQLKGGDHAR